MNRYGLMYALLLHRTMASCFPSSVPHSPSESTRLQESNRVRERLRRLEVPIHIVSGAEHDNYLGSRSRAGDEDGEGGRHLVEWN